MSGEYHLDSQEARDLSQKAQTQEGYLEEIVSRLEGVVQGTAWESRAAESFRTRWATDKGKLQQLADGLGAWSRDLNNRAAVWDEINRPFA